MPIPKASIVMITYGHEKYIAQAIEGVLMQQTQFPVELIIANDHSPDNTDNIVMKYIKEHPKGKIIKYFRHDKNLGMMPNFLFALKQAQSEYIALCEGDDYWTDPEKLQKQIDFLEINANFSMVCHDAIVINEIDNSSKLYFDASKKKQVCSTKDTLNVQFCPTASILFKRKSVLPLGNINILSQAGDQMLVQLISLKGLLYRMTDVMSVYRKTESGASEIFKQNLIGNLENRIDMLDYLNKISVYKYHKNIKIEKLLINNRISLIESKSNFKTIFLQISRKILSNYKKRLLI